MTGAFVCVLTFFFVFRCAKKSLGHGLGAVVAVGYVYGITRARLHDSFSHFMFDAAVIALYMERYGHWSSRAVERSRHVMHWLVMLIAWPTMLMVIPQQHPLIQLVGLRAAIFFLPFIAIGARVEERDLSNLTGWISILNVGAFGVAVAEYFVGIEPFFPRNAVTENMYLSTDIVGRAHRIPATFSSAHAYAGTMVATLPFVLTRWQSGDAGVVKKSLFAGAIVATGLGVFIAGPRLPVGILIIQGAVVGSTMRIPMRLKLGIAAFGTIVGGIVAQSARFQRFLLLRNTEKVVERIGWSVNMSFVDALREYPFGAGLGRAAGTSIPYFLADLMTTPQVGMENEYGRIALEQSLVGLALWIAFIFTTVTRPWAPVSRDWALGTRMMKIYVAVSWGTAFIGTGMLTSIPQTPLLLTMMGLLWRAPLPAAPARKRALPEHPRARGAPAPS